MMANTRGARVNAAVWVIISIMAFSGCADVAYVGTGDNIAGLTGRPTTKQDAVSGYLLEQAGFKKLPVYQHYTRSRAALADNIPIGKITTFESGGTIHYVYNDGHYNVLYVGDELAYQKYLSLTHGRNVCQVVKGEHGEQFWSCMQEYEQRLKQGLE
ncbi:MAG: hypothetical protein ACYC6G_02745 [Desulfobaccales bacterium]